MTTVLLHDSGPDHGAGSWPPDLPDLDDEVLVLTLPGFGSQPRIGSDSNEVTWLAGLGPVFTEVGAHLAALGATCVELPGGRHAPQLVAGFVDLMRSLRGVGPR